jgi:predicted PurR-regulated permease PerM
MTVRSPDLARITHSVPFIGRLVALGIVGIFVGPVVLAVAYTLLDDWVSADPAGRSASARAADRK